MRIKQTDLVLYDTGRVLVPLNNFDNSFKCYPCAVQENRDILATIYLKEPTAEGHKYTALCGNHAEVEQVDGVFL